VTAWSGSTRRQRLPQGWAAIRTRILQRDHFRCHVCGYGGATEVDHVNPGDDHSDTNLAAIHHYPCHVRKTVAERPQQRRQPEPHPGRVGDHPTP
jgi:5-methylcytosine-specific restriction protein A